MTTLRHAIGVTAAEVPAYLWALWGPGDWVRVRNRLETLVAAPDGQRGVRCAWRWTSDLRACRFYPPLGRALLRRALEDWPIRWHRGPSDAADDGPTVSVVIGHRGADKIPHLLATVETFLAQDGRPPEVVVVEQSDTPVLASLPAGVRHVHTPLPDAGLPYSRAWAFNVGARAAMGDILLLHDNDLLAPAGYVREAARVLETHEAAYLGRFVFYLDERATAQLTVEKERWAPARPTRVTQNFHGGTVAIRREAYLRIGGFDEGFVGWGGEDNELFDRCQAMLRCYPFGYLPFVHLHHAPQALKGQTRMATDYLEARLAVSPSARVEQLTARGFGRVEGPAHPAAQAGLAPASPQEMPA